MRTLTASVLAALVGLCVLPAIGSHAGTLSAQPQSVPAEFPHWTEITSNTDASDFGLNCEYYAVFEYLPGAERSLFMNFVAVGETGYPGVTSSVSADASRGQVFRVDNTAKDTVKSDALTFPARVFERCYRQLPRTASE